MSKETGGPAFPQSAFWTESDNPYDSEDFGGRGMTLRDHFAGLAMQGLCAHPDTWGLTSAREIAGEAYELADAMIAARGE